MAEAEEAIVSEFAAMSQLHYCFMPATYFGQAWHCLYPAYSFTALQHECGLRVSDMTPAFHDASIVMHALPVRPAYQKPHI